MLHLSDFTIRASFGTESKDFLRSINNSSQELFKVNASLLMLSQKNITAVSVEW